MEIVKKSIVDIEEFCKLYKLNIPIKEEFQYYIDVLQKSREYGYPNNSLKTSILSFIELEFFVSQNGYKSVRDYKNKCMDELIEHIIHTSAYKALTDAKMPVLKMEKRDWIKRDVSEDDVLMSLDFRSANYSILKTFQSQGESELGENWVDLCSKFDIHPCLANSKSFRQIVFGNTNPKRLNTFQHEKTMHLVEFLSHVLGFKDDKIIFISHDEVIVKVKSASEVNFIMENYFEKMKEITGMPIRTTYFSLKKIRKETFVKTVLSVSICLDSNTILFSEKYKTLHGANGNKFYMFFKKYILNYPVEDRDLFYYNDGELTKWVNYEEFKKEKINLPNYKKPDIVITKEEAEKDYPAIWTGMDNLVPGLSKEEKRRIVELFKNNCKNCYNGDYN